jgi:hypothetical protein
LELSGPFPPHDRPDESVLAEAAQVVEVPVRRDVTGEALNGLAHERLIGNDQLVAIDEALVSGVP